MEAPGLTPPPFYQIAAKCVNQWENIFLVRLRIDNDNCTHTSLDCGMPKWVGFFKFLGELHLSAFGCEVTRQWGILEDLSDLNMGPWVAFFIGFQKHGFLPKKCPGGFFSLKTWICADFLEHDCLLAKNMFLCSNFTWKFSQTRHMMVLILIQSWRGVMKRCVRGFFSIAWIGFKPSLACRWDITTFVRK